MAKVDWEKVAPDDLESLVTRDDDGNLFCRLCQQILPRRFSLRDPDLLQHWEINHSSELSALTSKPKRKSKPQPKPKPKPASKSSSPKKTAKKKK